MTEHMERLVTPPDVPEIRKEVRTPVLITAAEVVFSTAAAAPLRTVRAGWRTAVFAVQRTFAATMSQERSQKRRPPRHHPKRLRYLEDARMEREMSRL